MEEHATYTLRATVSGWDLCLNGQRLTSFEAFSEAERAAIAGGEESRRQGKAVEIYVQARNGETNLILKAGHETH
jgi:hypothetical protein